MKNFCLSLLDFLFPAQKVCPFCQKNKVINLICADCRKKLTFLTESRESLAVYTGLMQEVMQRFKYRGESELALPLAELLREKFGELSGLIVPLPMHEGRLRERGYNQTQLLALALEEITYCKIYPALSKIKATASQTKLNRYERLDNIAGAFKVVKKVRGLKLILLDDVLTTGATVNEARKELILAGAKEVKILTLAKGNFLDKENI